MDPVIIEVPEEPGLTGLQEIMRAIKRTVNPDPWEQSPPIILRGTVKALALIKLMRLDQVDGIRTESLAVIELQKADPS